MKKRIFILATLLFASYSEAQDLADGITEATSQVVSIIEPIKTFFYALAAVVGFYGAFRVFTKHQNGDQDTQKAMGQFGFAFIFFIAAGYVIGAVFGV